jgi:hypothetical protein
VNVANDDPPDDELNNRLWQEAKKIASSQRGPNDNDPLRVLTRAIKAEGMAAIINCEIAADRLFDEIEQHHGAETARHIFSKYAKPPSKWEPQRAARRELVWMVELDEGINGKRNIDKVARELAKWNETAPPERRYGTGTTDPLLMEQQIYRALKDKRHGGGGITISKFLRLSGFSNS